LISLADTPLPEAPASVPALALESATVCSLAAPDADSLLLELELQPVTSTAHIHAANTTLTNFLMITLHRKCKILIVNSYFIFNLTHPFLSVNIFVKISLKIMQKGVLYSYIVQKGRFLCLKKLISILSIKVHDGNVSQKSTIQKQ
jgi:hypothetical protein